MTPLSTFLTQRRPFLKMSTARHLLKHLSVAAKRNIGWQMLHKVQMQESMTAKQEIKDMILRLELELEDLGKRGYNDARLFRIETRIIDLKRILMVKSQFV